MTAIRPRPSDPDPGEESTPKNSEAAATSQSADEDAPVETSTDYTFDGAVLYTDLPDAPTGSYMGSQGLPVATGETKIGISAWPNDQLEESADSYLSADTLNSDDLTLTAPLLEGTDYAVAAHSGTGGISCGRHVVLMWCFPTR